MSWIDRLLRTIVEKTIKFLELYEKYEKPFFEFFNSKKQKIIKDDELMTANLEALKAGGKMKMQGYGDLWHQFQLEKQGALIRKQTKAMQGRRKTVRR